MYAVLHKETGYKWNIQDRSALSMLCYARLYGRDETKYRKMLQLELDNLNNRMIILLPPFAVIKERFHKRGDEIQDLESLQALYKIFDEESKAIEKRPTVMCIRETVDLDMIWGYVSEWSHSIESCKALHVGEVIKHTLHAVKENELTLTAKLEYELSDYDTKILSDEHEGEYYTKIKDQLCETIQNELDGKNEYNTPQDLSSRRFFYHSDTCISGIHLMPRGKTLKTHVFLRSTDVDRNAEIDLQFLEFLTHFLNQKFNFRCSSANLEVKFNSAHIRDDLEN